MLIIDKHNWYHYEMRTGVEQIGHIIALSQYNQDDIYIKFDPFQIMEDETVLNVIRKLKKEGKINNYSNDIKKEIYKEQKYKTPENDVLMEL